MNTLETEAAEIKKIVENKKILTYPPLKKSDVNEFCQKYDVDLPEEYVLFLTEIGDGWKKTKNDMYSTINMNRLSESFSEGENLQREFPFVNGWVWEDGGGEEWPQSEGESDEEYEERLTALEESALYGQITLIDVGGGGSWNLVISGKCKGQIWFVCGEGVMPCTDRFTFFGWLRKWLDGVKEIGDYLYIPDPDNGRIKTADRTPQTGAKADRIAR